MDETKLSGISSSIIYGLWYLDALISAQEVVSGSFCVCVLYSVFRIPFPYSVF